MDMPAKEVLRRLIEEELQVQGSRVRQSHYETRQRAAGAANHDVAEVSPVGLGLLAG
jgi:hypothetical protein